MSETSRVQERERDLDRFLTFIDAIVAIAITLLVLPLVELSADVDRSGSVADLLGDNAQLLWSFALSFYVIARFWFGQHRAVGPLLQGSRRVHVLMLAWVFTIVVLPFPTSLVASSAGHEALSKALYIGTMTLSVLCVAALRTEIGRHPELTDGTPYDGPAGPVSTAVLLLLALALAVAVPALSYFPLLLLALDGPLTRLLRARNRST